MSEEKTPEEVELHYIKENWNLRKEFINKQFNGFKDELEKQLKTWIKRRQAYRNNKELYALASETEQIIKQTIDLNDMDWVSMLLICELNERIAQQNVLNRTIVDAMANLHSKNRILDRSEISEKEKKIDKILRWMDEEEERVKQESKNREAKVRFKGWS